MSEWGKVLLAHIAANPGIAVLLVAATSFGESFPVVSLVVPGGVVLIGAGALVVTGTLDPFVVIAAAVAGTVLGDLVTYGIGRKFGTQLLRKWPFRKHPETLAQGVAFFHRYGHASVFIGRFFGPLRSVIPTTAGITKMHFGEFLTSTFVSALIYAPMLMFSGYVLSHVISSGFSIWYKIGLIALAAGLLALGLHTLRRLIAAK